MDIGEYLQRIGFIDSIEHDRNTLDRLIRAQLTHVPFEALDIWARGVCPSLDVQQLYQKIVTENRGGYCFELNTLFRVLLNELGFAAYQAISSLVDENGVAAPAAHNVIICTLNEEKYLVDVGFGGPVPFGAMPMKEETWGNFCLRKQDDFWCLDRWEEDRYRPSIRFRDVPASMEELIPLNFYISQKPDSHFRHRVNVSIKRPDGSIHRLLGDMLHVHTAERAVDRRISRGELQEVLQTHFAIQYTSIPEGKSLCGGL